MLKTFQMTASTFFGLVGVLSLGMVFTAMPFGPAETSIGIEMTDAELYSIRGAQMTGPCVIGTPCSAIGITCTLVNGACASTDACGSCTGLNNKSCANSSQTNCMQTMKPCCSPGKKCQLNSNGCACRAFDFVEQIGTQADC
jgi:hypothetical protein